MGRSTRACALLLTMLGLTGPAAAQASGGFAASQSFTSGWQCVTFARAFSGIQLFGNAATWWHQAVGQYEQGFVPRVGGVMVFKPFAHMHVGHVATVSEVISPREIKVTHANWSPVDGRRGAVEQNVTVVDTSAAGDWSRVRVWYAPLGDLGRTDYPIYGFIYGHAAQAFESTAHAVAAIEALPAELAGL